MAQSRLTAITASWVQEILLPQPPEYLRLQVHARLTFVFLVEMGFHHVGQAGLELLTSGDPPTLAFQTAEIVYRCESLCPARYLFILNIYYSGIYFGLAYKAESV